MSVVVPRKARRFGFTLVELLVVIGIIALLISILLPSLAAAREQGNRTKCLSNLKQIATAMVAYANNNKLYLPAPAPYNRFRAEDFIHWEVTGTGSGGTGNRNIEESALSTFLGRPFPQDIWKCPSDDVASRARTTNYTGYHFSYVMNGLASPFTSTATKFPVTRYVNHTRKIILYEEDENTIDDGYGTMNVSSINMLAIRHDRKRVLPDNTTNGLTLNGDRRGNVCFADGHAEYIDRNSAHTPEHYDPFKK